jgi:hypothetical protein
MQKVKIAAISLSGVVAAAALAACSTPSPQSGASQPTPRVVGNVHPYTAGAGTVIAVMPSPTSAAAGGTAQPMQRLEIKMDNGTVQYVDTASKEFSKGTRVVLTQDKLIRKM